MTRLFYCCTLVLSLALAGCAEPNTPADATASDVIPTGEPAADSEAAPSGEPAASEEAANESISDEAAESAEDSPVADAPAEVTKIDLTPKTTSIQFVGNHTGDDPKPRRGSFQKFTGSAEIGESLQSVQVEIETASVTTEIEKLTNHLKSADFFDVNQFPRASFRSTSIKDNGDGTATITGDLTLLGNTHSITFPASVSTAGGGLQLKAEFEIDRTQFGMNFNTDGVEKQVPMTITVGA